MHTVKYLDHNILANIERQVTKDLAERGIVTRTIVFPEAYLGLGLKWSPIYGKMAYKDQKIVPFDMYFSLGGGITKTNQDTTDPTLSVGLGQMFALNRWIGLRWDFSWNFFKAEVEDINNEISEGTFDNLLLTVGFSFFFGGSSSR